MNDIPCPWRLIEKSSTRYRRLVILASCDIFHYHSGNVKSQSLGHRFHLYPQAMQNKDLAAGCNRDRVQSREQFANRILRLVY